MNIKNIAAKLHNKMRRLMNISITALKYSIQIRKSKCCIVNVPEHDNVGDLAIAIAEEQLLNNLNVSFCEINEKQFHHFEWLFAILTPSYKTVFVHGGGYLGSIWPVEEYCFRRTLAAFKRHHVVVFPQTISFDTEDDNTFFEESKRAYSEHHNLQIFLREKKSYDFCKKRLPNVDINLVPDIVTLLQIDFEKKHRDKILICLRNDREKKISFEDSARISSILKETFPHDSIMYTDTVLSHVVPAENRLNEVTKKLNEFASAKLIITDRLHGMIFAALTGTCCIAFGNKNGKVEGVYEWIKNNSFVHYVHSFKEFSTVLKSYQEEAFEYHAPINDFDTLINTIKMLN